VVTGRLSIRDEKEPQIVVNRVRPISDFAQMAQMEAENPPVSAVQGKPLRGTLYLRLDSETDPRYRKVKAILNMFPGENGAVLFFADTKIRRGTRCELRDNMLQELKNLLGNGNVVLK
jgi:DNA polymerase-3 subunit alpha